MILGAIDFAGIGILLTGIATLIVAISNNVISRKTQKEVKTFNESPIGQLAAESETRRIKAIEHDARTFKEQRHLDESPVTGPGQGPDSVAI